jgi:hypothetical protein
MFFISTVEESKGIFCEFRITHFLHLLIAYACAKGLVAGKGTLGLRS